MKTPGDRKITVGFVIQTFNDKGKCIEQEFVAGDQVDWQNEDGYFIPTPVHDYQPFHMVQPASEIEELKATIARYEAEEYDRQMTEKDNG